MICNNIVQNERAPFAIDLTCVDPSEKHAACLSRNRIRGGAMIVRQSVLGRDTEQLIAATRVFLATAALVAPYFDARGAITPPHYIFITIYGVIGAGVLLTQSGVGRPTLAKTIHALDLAFATIMITAPSGAGYFLILATFCLLSSVVQWRWPVVLMTGAYLCTAYLLAVGLHFVSAERMTIRTTYLILAPLGTALAARSSAGSRMRLLKLARWSSSRYSGKSDAVLRVFEHAADVLEAEEIVVFYHEVDQPTAIKATYSRRDGRLEQAPCETWPDEITSEQLRRHPFVVVDPERSLCLTYAGMKRAPGATPALGLSGKSGIIASAPFSGDFFSGRLFACGIKSWRWDQIVLVEIVASHVRSRLEGRTLRDRAVRMTAELERMRLARALHDGILQSLTAARLQLHALTKDAPEFEQRLNLIADMLQDEQQKLREFVENSRAPLEGVVPITRLAERIRIVAEHWRMRAHVDIDRADAEVPDALYREVYFIIGEAIANSARHGLATTIRASLSCASGIFVLMLEEEDGAASPDDGRRVSPRSLEGRVRDLGGALAISQGPFGVSLRVELPTDG
jgi:signal transduction histidine kinase